MRRVKLDLPEPVVFSTDLSVRVGDLNYGGHLGNDAVLALVHEARIRYLEELGYTEEDIGGSSLIMADAAVEYRAEGFRGEKVRVEIMNGDTSTTGFDLYYRITKQPSETVLARVKTGMVSYDYDRERVVPIPETFREKIST